MEQPLCLDQPITARPAHLEGQVVVLLLLVGTEGVPPLAQDLADCAIVLVGVALVHQSAVALAEDHERVHRTADVVFLPLGEGLKNKGRKYFFSNSLDFCTLFFPPKSTDLPVSILWQGAQGLSAALHWTSGGCRIVGHARGEAGEERPHKFRLAKQILYLLEHL